MNTITLPGLKRISKHAARRLWGQNATISLCPVKLRPDGPWRPNVDYFPEEQREREFDKVVSEFEHYNITNGPGISEGTTRALRVLV